MYLILYQDRVKGAARAHDLSPPHQAVRRVHPAQDGRVYGRTRRQISSLRKKAKRALLPMPVWVKGTLEGSPYPPKVAQNGKLEARRTISRRDRKRQTREEAESASRSSCPRCFLRECESRNLNSFDSRASTGGFPKAHPCLPRKRGRTPLANIGPEWVRDFRGTWNAFPADRVEGTRTHQGVLQLLCR